MAGARGGSGPDRAPVAAGADGGVVVLAGGTGGAKLARGMLDAIAPGALTVIANTGDDVEVYGAHVSPDPDLCCFWLADLIDARGWGLRDDSFEVMRGLRELGIEVWFNLGDRDLAIAIERARRLAAGERLTDVLAWLGDALGLRARVLPMSDAPVRTFVHSGGRRLPFQEFMVRERAAGPVEDVELQGIEGAAPTPEALEAIASAAAIVIGPSNPVISIGPILAVPGMRAALARARAPVVAVSPFVGGEVVKGPTVPFMTWAGLEPGAAGVAEHYGELLDGMLADEHVPGLPCRVADTLMSDAAGRLRVAGEALALAWELAS